MWVGIGVGIGRNRFATGIFNDYALRVTADGGITEAGGCVDAGATPLLQTASLLLIPSGYKGGKLYSEIPTNGNGDFTWTRASDGTRVNASGVIQRVPWNLWQRSEEFDNASWSKANTSITANTTSSPNGTLTADTLSIGVDASAVRHRLYQSITATIGTTYTGTYYLKANQHQWIQIVAVSGFSTGVWANFDLVNGTIGNTGGVDTTASIENVGNGWYRCRVGGVATATSTTGFEILTTNNTNSGKYPSYQSLVAENVCYVWGAQIVEGSSAETYLPTTDRFGFPRLDYSFGSCPSVLLEPQRTNGVRNSTMVGASTSPSTFPTNYTGAGTIVGVGIENGLNYFDLRFNGTAATTTVDLFNPETTTAIAALTGQVWSQSVYLKFVSTTNPPNSNQITGLMFELNSSGSFVASAGFIQPTITSTLTRYNLTATLSGGASTAFVRPVYRFPATIGQSYDFTIRIASPQMELGAFPSTWIPTSGTSATRVADSFSRNNIFTNGLITSSGGTWFVEFRVASTIRDNGNTIRIGDASNAFNIAAGISGTGYGFILNKSIGGTGTNLYFAFLGTSAFVKLAIKWNGTTADVFANGTKVVSATAFTPTNLPDLTGSFGTPIFIKQMALFSTPLSDTNCTTLTT